MLWCRGVGLVALSQRHYRKVGENRSSEVRVHSGATQCLTQSCCCQKLSCISWRVAASQSRLTFLLGTQLLTQCTPRGEHLNLATLHYLRHPKQYPLSAVNRAVSFLSKGLSVLLWSTLAGGAGQVPEEHTTPQVAALTALETLRLWRDDLKWTRQYLRPDSWEGSRYRFLLSPIHIYF